MVEPDPSVVELVETTWPAAALLWDLDGTLVDTEPYWIEAEYDLAARYGGAWSDVHALELVGNDLLACGRYIREHMGIDLEPAEIVEQLLDDVIARVERTVPWRPGAVELLADLRPQAFVARWSPCRTAALSHRSWPACRHPLSPR